MRLNSLLPALLAAFTLAGPALAQTANTVPAPEQSPAATIGQVGWLAGAWTGTGFGGESDEQWAEPAAGAMIGTFRLVVGGKAVFYQFLTIGEENGTLALKLKHFNADLTPWEEKERWVTFRLARIAENEVAFSGLTFRRTGDTTMTIFLAQRGRDGAVREERFEMRRK